MILNIILLLITVLIIYLGYTYKALILFIASMVIDDLYIFFYKFKSYKMVYDKEKECYILNFFIEDKEYTFIIPKENIKEPEKILALSGASNKTQYINKLLGPRQDFFSTGLKLKHTNLNKLVIWKNKKMFRFEHEDDILSFDILKQTEIITSNESDID